MSNKKWKLKDIAKAIDMHEKLIEQAEMIASKAQEIKECHGIQGSSKYVPRCDTITALDHVDIEANTIAFDTEEYYQGGHDFEVYTLPFSLFTTEHLDDDLRALMLEEAKKNAELKAEQLKAKEEEKQALEANEEYQLYLKLKEKYK